MWCMLLLLVGAALAGEPTPPFRGDSPLYEGVADKRARVATSDTGLLWPEGIIYYEVHPSLFSYESLLRGAMNEFERETNSCVRFIHRVNMPHSARNYVEIRGDYSGCWSMVGMQGTGMQVVSLSWDGCLWKGLMLHTFMKTLGFFHEQNRPDRDDYVEILWENIITGLEDTFKIRTKEESVLLGEVYDFKSVLHFELNAFAKDEGLYTIRPKDPSITEDVVGQVWSKEFSTSDIIELNRLYRCPGTEQWWEQHTAPQH